MKQKLIDFSKTHLIIIFSFILLSLAYFSPVLEGKVLNQSDMVNASGMSHELEQYHEETGEYAQWTNSMFGGMPPFIWDHMERKQLSSDTSVISLDLD